MKGAETLDFSTAQMKTDELPPAKDGTQKPTKEAMSQLEKYEMSSLRAEGHRE